MAETRACLGEQEEYDSYILKVYRVGEDMYEIDVFWTNGEFHKTEGPYDLVTLSDTYADNLEFEKYGIKYTPSFVSNKLKSDRAE